MYKFKGDPNLIIFEHKTNRRLAVFDSKGLFETSDQYVIQKLIKAGYEYSKKDLVSDTSSKDEEITKLTSEKESLEKELEELKAKIATEEVTELDPSSEVKEADSEDAENNQEIVLLDEQTVVDDSNIPSDEKTSNTDVKTEITDAPKEKTKKSKDIE